jgi:hypothetical protein
VRPKGCPAIIFLSYTRTDVALVRALREDFERLGWQVWMDHEIHGGEQWWREIIRTIQYAEVFVFALSQDSWTSQPCREELRYAQRLGIPVLPVQVGPLHSVRIPIMETQGIDYRERSADAALALVAALTDLIARPVERPDPLPEPPGVPFEYLYRIAEILGPTPIAPDHQEAVIGQLRRKLKEEHDEVARADIVKLLRDFRGRSELTVGNAEEIDELLTGAEAAKTHVPEDGATRLPPTEHWRRTKESAPIPDTKPVPRPQPPSPPPPRTPPKPRVPKPDYRWRTEPTTPEPAEAPPTAAAPAWLHTLINDETRETTATQPPPPPPAPPTAQWWNAPKPEAEERKPEPPPPPPAPAPTSPRDHRLAFVSAILGAAGIPFGFAAALDGNSTAVQAGLSLLLIVSVLGLSLGLVSVSRGEPRSRVAVVIAIAGLLGAILFAAGHF